MFVIFARLFGVVVAPICCYIVWVGELGERRTGGRRKEAAPCTVLHSLAGNLAQIDVGSRGSSVSDVEMQGRLHAAHPPGSLLSIGPAGEQVFSFKLGHVSTLRITPQPPNMNKKNA